MTHTRQTLTNLQDGKRVNLIMGVHTGILQQQVDTLSKAAAPPPILAK